MIEEKLTKLLTVLRGSVENFENDWTSKQREDYIFNLVLSLDFIENGQFIIKNKTCVSKIKLSYKSLIPDSFTTKNLTEYFTDINVDSIYFLKEPFGSKASPDFLIISPKGIIGIEDKSSKVGKVSFNTGTPGGNKFIMYFDKKDKKIYLVSGKNWGWDDNIEKEYIKFTKDMITYGQKKFEETFGSRLKNMTYYSRPMLVDKNKIKDIWDGDEKEIIKMLRKHL